MEDKDLQSWRRAYRESLANTDSAQPTDEELASLLTDDLDPARREDIAQRMLRHRESIEKYSILVELAGDKSAPKFAPPRWLFATAAAALAMLAITPVLVGDRSEVALRSDTASPSAPSEYVVLDAAPRRLDWPDVASASGYRVTLFDSAAREIWRSGRLGGRDSWTELPDDIAWSRGETYFWVVEPDGVATRTSLGPYWFRLAP